MISPFLSLISGYIASAFPFPWFFFFKQKTAYDIMPSLVGSEMCIRDRHRTRRAPCGPRPVEGLLRNVGPGRRRERGGGGDVPQSARGCGEPAAHVLVEVLAAHRQERNHRRRVRSDAGCPRAPTGCRRPAQLYARARAAGAGSDELRNSDVQRHQGARGDQPDQEGHHLRLLARRGVQGQIWAAHRRRDAFEARQAQATCRRECSRIALLPRAVSYTHLTLPTIYSV